LPGDISLYWLTNTGTSSSQLYWEVWGGNPFNAVDISTIPVAVTVLAEGDPRYDDLEKRLAEGPVIAVPTITLDGDSDGVAPATDGTSHAKKFSGKRTHKIIKGIGHNLPQEAPQAFAEAVVEVDGYFK